MPGLCNFWGQYYQPSTTTDLRRPQYTPAIHKMKDDTSDPASLKSPLSTIHSTYYYCLYNFKKILLSRGASAQ